ncbi:hypothetical protein GQ600_17516 [Phytophthora cactorum]|nr:hypothetical protein GQ600_17516 [Phytophthora cactorum]
MKKAACRRRKVLHPRRHYGRRRLHTVHQRVQMHFWLRANGNESARTEQNQKQFEDRLAFEKEQVEARLQFEKQLQIRNSEMILECANIFSAAMSKNKE